tara:strand:+ start:12025 stop:12525 length:501 start_codon:yes stop_codon:yes gene_type:complete
MSKENKKMPSIFTMAKNFAKDLGTYIKEGAPNVTHAQYTERLKACNTCPKLDKEKMRCTLCGCLVEHKAKWKTTTCPDKPPRWKPMFKSLAGPKNENVRKAIATNKILHKAYDAGIFDPKKPETANPILRKLGYDDIIVRKQNKECDGCDEPGESNSTEKGKEKKG